MPNTPKAVVDIGSNTVHLLVARWDGDRLHQLNDSSRRSGLAEDMQRHGAISQRRVALLADSVACMVQRAAACGADDVQLLATEVIRAADNRDAIVQALGTATCLPIRVLASAEEAYLAAVGAAIHSPWERTALVVDIGGGSIQIALATATSVVATVSAPLSGCIGEAAAREGAPPPPRPVRGHELPDHLSRAMSRLPAFRAVEAVIVTGGAARRLVKLKPDGCGNTLSRTYVERQALCLGSAAGRADAVRRGVSPRKVGTTHAGAVVLGALLGVLDRDGCTFSPWGLREGALLPAIERTRRLAPPDERFASECVSAQLQLAIGR